MQVAQGIYQAIGQGLFTGPDAAPGDGLYLLVCHPPTAGHAGLEAGVGGANVGPDLDSLSIAEGGGVGIETGGLAPHDCLPPSLELFKEAPGDDLASPDTDRSSEGCWLSQDGVGCGRDVVASGSGQVAHIDHHRFCAAKVGNFPPDQVRCQGRASWRVHVEDDSGQVFVLSGSAKLLGQCVGAGLGGELGQR